MTIKKIALIIISIILTITWVLLSCDPPTEDDPNFITVTSSTYELPADGQATATITVVVYDNTHAPAEDGTAVYFTIDPSNKGVMIDSVAAISGGQATATLTAGNIPANIVVHVEVPSENRNANSDTIEIQGTGPDNLDLTSSHDSIKANGEDSCTITAYVTRDAADQEPVEDGTEINFTASKGSLSSTTATTTDGFASVTLTAGTVPGTCDITATVQDMQKTISVEFLPTDASNIVLTSNQDYLPANGVSSTTIIARVYYQYPDEFVDDGTPVYFDTTEGSISPKETTTTGGYAYATLTSDTTAGYAEVSCSSGGETARIYIYFYDIGPAYINLTANPPSIPANGNSSSTIVAIVKDDRGEPVEGTEVEFSTTEGSLSPTTDTTDSGGAARTRLQSSLNVGTATVTGVASDVRDSVNVNFTEPSSTEVFEVLVDSLTPELIVDDEDCVDTTVPPSNCDLDYIVSIYVLVRNEYYQPLTNKLVNIQTECGIFQSNIGYTNAFGVIYFDLDTSSCDEAVIRTITANCEGIEGSDTIDFRPADPCNLSMSINTNNISGVGSATITASAYDRWYNNVEDGERIRLEITTYDCNDPSDEDSISLSSTYITLNNGSGNALLRVYPATNDTCNPTITGTIENPDHDEDDPDYDTYPDGYYDCEADGTTLDTISITVTP